VTVAPPPDELAVSVAIVVSCTSHATPDVSAVVLQLLLYAWNVRGAPTVAESLAGTTLSAVLGGLRKLQSKLSLNKSLHAPVKATLRLMSDTIPASRHLASVRRDMVASFGNAEAASFSRHIKGQSSEACRSRSQRIARAHGGGIGQTPYALEHQR